MRPRRAYDIDQDANIAMADGLIYLEMYHVAYDYYKYVVEWYEDYQAANDYSRHQARLYAERDKILCCKAGMLGCQFRMAAVELSVLENNVRVLIGELSVAIQRRGSDKKSLRACKKTMSDILVELASPGVIVGYLLSGAKLLNEKIHTAAFSEYAQSMEIDETNFDQKYYRLNAAAQSLCQYEMAEEMVASLNDKIDYLCVERSKTLASDSQVRCVMQQPIKKRRLGADIFADVHALAPQDELPHKHVTFTDTDGQRIVLGVRYF